MSVLAHINVNSILLSALLWSMATGSFVHAETIEGFRDLKFGMTPKEVTALEACQTASECLYELVGKNRYLVPVYQQQTGSGHEVSSSNHQGPSAQLVRVTIDMGHFTDQWYGELQMMLGKKYQLTHDLSEQAIQTFQTEHTSELVSGYENGQVLLKVIRRKFGNLVLTVVYQNDAMAAESIKKMLIQ